MKKISLLTLLVTLSACKSEQIEGEAIHARVLLTSQVVATCVLFEVRDPVSKGRLEHRWVPRVDEELKIAVFRGSLPETVELAARPYRDGSCQEGQEGRPNGQFETVTASFVTNQITQANELRLSPGQDGDGDQFVDEDAGGADCNDGAGTVNPGVVEQCTHQTDLNCDGKKGCEASGCPATACIGPPTALALEVQAGSVTAGTCTGAAVKVKDERGSDTQVTAPAAVSLQTQSGGVAFFSDAACTTSIASVNLAMNEGSAPFFFLGQVAGEVTLNASATGLTPASRAVQIIAGPGNRLIFTSAARTAVAGACSQVVQFQSQDAQGNPAPVAAATRVALSAAPSTGFTFYTDAGCTSAVTGLDLLAGTSNSSFFFRGTRAGSVSLSLTAPGFTGSLQTATINPGSPSAMVFTGPATLPAGDCSGLVTVELRDAHDNPTAATSATNISLTATGVPLTFSTNAGCTPTTGTVTIAQSATSTSFRYQGTQAGASSISGNSGSLTRTPLSVTILPGTASALVFTTTPQTVTAGACSGAATVQLRDAFGNAAAVAASTPVGLSVTPPEGFQFFSDSSCAGGAVTSVTMPASSSNASFYFTGTRAGMATLAATLGSITANQGVTISPGMPTALAFPQSPLTVTAGACTPVTLRVNDTHGNAAPVSGNQTIDLAASPSTGFTFSTAADCSSSTSQVTITSGQSSTTVHVRGTVAGNVTATANRVPFSQGTLALIVTPAGPSKIAFLSAPQTLDMGACSAITTVRLLDAFDNVAMATANTQLGLSGSTGTSTFYSDAGCTSTTTSTTVSAGQSSAGFYFKDTAPGTVTITVSGNGLTSALQPQTINPLAPTELAFTTPARTVQVGACSDIVTVETRASGSPTTVISATTVNLAPTPAASLIFYSDSTCTTVVTSVTINAGQGSASFYFTGAAPGTVTITASSGILTSPPQSATLTPVPTQWRFTTGAHTVVAGSCSPMVTVQSADASNNAAPVATNTTVTLADSGTPSDPQFRFYSDASCSTVIPSVTVLRNQSTANFYFRGEKARTVTVTASGTLTSATQDHTITPGSLAALAFSAGTPPQTLLAGTCALRTVQSQDAFGNLVSPGVTATLSASSPTAEFFSDAGCTTATSEVSIAAGNSTASFYFKGITGGINATALLTLTAAASGLTSDTQTESIIPTVRTGTCILDGVSVTCPIAPVLLDVNKAFLTFQATSTHARSDRGNVRCFLDGVTQVRCERFDANATVNIRWSVAEFPSGVAVQSHAPSCTGDTTPVTLFAAAPSGTFLLLSSQRDVAHMGSTVFRLVEMKSPTLAEIRKLGGCIVTDTNHLQAVSYAGSSVQRSVTSLASGSTNTQVTLPSPVAPDRSIVLYSYTNDGTSTRICERALRGELINNGATVRFSRGEGDTVNCAGSNFGEIPWEVVTFPVGTVVQQVTQQLAAATATGSTTLTTPVDMSRTLVFGGGQWSSGQLHGEGRLATSENINEMRAQAVLSNNSTLLFYRDSSTNSATFTAYVVQFKP